MAQSNATSAGNIPQDPTDAAHHYCRLSPDYSLQQCGICLELAKLETQISDREVNAQNIPQDLSEDSHHIALKKLRNLSHDRLARRLPVELISRIFTLIQFPVGHSFSILHYSNTDYVCVPAFLSRICTRWREIALATPQLWTDVYLNLQKHSVDLDITKEWLLRSGSLPLNLSLYRNPSKRYGIPSLDPIINLVRSHSSRWQYLDVRLVENDVFTQLFHNLDTVPRSEFLDLRIAYLPSHPKMIFLHTPLRPRRFHSCSLGGIMFMPLKWDNLVDLRINCDDDTNVLRVIEQAPNLQRCNLININTDAGPSHTQTSVNPIIHHSLTDLSLRSTNHRCRYLTILRYIALPSLLSLSCNLNLLFSPLPDPLEFDNLIDFIERSGLTPNSLVAFSLCYRTSLEANFERSRLFSLTQITHLTMRMAKTNTLTNFLQRLSSDIAVFPRLQSLAIIGQVCTDPESWDIFCDFIVEHNSNVRAAIDAGRPSLDEQNTSQTDHHHDQPFGTGHSDVNQDVSVPLPVTSITVQQPCPRAPATGTRRLLEVVSFMDTGIHALRLRKDTCLRLRDVQRYGPITLKIGPHPGEMNLFDPELRFMKEEDGFIFFV